MMTLAATIVHGGVPQMQKFLQKERSRFRSMILIVSQPTVEDRTSPQQTLLLRHAIQHTTYLLQQKLGFQAIVAHCSPNAFPTAQDIDNVMNLSQRVGAPVVGAVGTGNAMDVAKVAFSSHGLFDELLLIPLTYGASIAATSSHALLYDAQENTLFPHPSMDETSREDTARPTTIISLNDSTMFDTRTNKDSTLFALLAIVLDRMFQNGTTECMSSYNEMIGIAEQILSCLEPAIDDKQEQEVVSNLCHSVGRSLSYGFHSQNPRSIPLALAVSLIPASNTFAQYSITTVLGSFVPAYIDLFRLQREDHHPDLIRVLERIPASMAPKIITNEPYDTLLSHIHSNQVQWNSCDYDGDDDVYRTLLKNHLLY
jgi:hypothetical protein